MDSLDIIRKSFKEYFGEPGIELPNELETGVVWSLDNAGSGWDINCKLYLVDGCYYLDFYACHRMTNSRHHRIMENGEVIELENFWEFGLPVYNDDPERQKRERDEIYRKNKEVKDILESKGLY